MWTVQVNKKYQPIFKKLFKSGLYQDLFEKKYLVPHVEVDKEISGDSNVYKVLKPTSIPFISYPYEWSFSQLKDAALLTLDIAEKSLDYGFILKDASAYNIQFINGKPILIDTLSFEPYKKGTPWIAYKQFCEHFLGPLAIMSYVDCRLSSLLRANVDGLPLDLVAKILPARAYTKFGLFAHVFLHAKSQKAFSNKTLRINKTSAVSDSAIRSIFGSLRKVIKKLEFPKASTEWGEYYSDTNYNDDAFRNKKEIVNDFIETTKPREVWDVGANDGLFSDISSEKGIFTVSMDGDYNAVENNYLRIKKNKNEHVLPLVIDLVNPSPGVGWLNEERKSLIERGPVDLCLALALSHHLSIGNNLPFSHQARFFSEICRSLVIEFIPESDSNVQRLLRTRENVFFDYDKKHFDNAFSEKFKIKETRPIKGSERILYLMDIK